MLYSGINEQIERTKKRIQNVKSVAPATAREIFVDLTKSENVSKGPLTREKFKELIVDYEQRSPDDLEIGQFVRYKHMTDGIVKFVRGGVLIYKDPRYLRMKNVITNARWSVQLKDPKKQHVFYQKKKETLGDNGLYVDLNKATTKGLLSAVIDRGDYEELEAAAKLAKKMSREKHSF
ncbi:hypothetical protein PBCVNEJV1_075L [Paramecium bursaria Chlorella virus NE-JV-1]|nr:hypothetical protein PBCVNEJV1_075L [Paramecium bursaria Chlorella virus NE-JV-1]